MALVAKDNGSNDFQQAPEGTHRAVCYRLIDLGTQHNAHFDKWQHQVYIGWELSDELTDDGKPLIIGRTYTVSLSEKANLRAHLEAWRGRKFTVEELNGFELQKVLGASCLVTVTHTEKNGKSYANVAAVAALPKSVDKPTGVNTLTLYSIEDGENEVFASLPEWMRERIAACRERNSEPVTDAGDPLAEFDDDIPF